MSSFPAATSPTAPPSARASAKCTSSASSPASPESPSSRPRAPTPSSAPCRKTTARHVTPVVADTRASAIRIGNPASFRKAVNTIHSTGGWCEQASEHEIALAKAEIGAEGIGCEPASAATLAGLKKLVAAGHITPEQRVVLILTGHTLKDPEYTIDYHRGSLLRDDELTSATTAELALHASLRKPPTVLDANADAVLRTIDAVLQTPVHA